MIILLASATILGIVTSGYAAPVNQHQVVDPDKTFISNPHRLPTGNKIVIRL